MGGSSRGWRIGGALVAMVLVASGAVGVGPGADRIRSAEAAAGTSTIAVIGDFGTGGASETSVANLVKGWAPDAVLATGDDYYATSGPTGLAKYDLTVGRDYCPFLAGVYSGTYCAGGTAATNRFFSSTGNHDYSDAGIDLYTGYFAFPSNERYFQTTIGAVEVFVIDTSASASDIATQKTWLEAAVRASTAAWQVAVFHHPPYSSGSHGSQTAFQWPFASWGVDLVLNGHDHTYERIARDGITYVVDGLGGASRYAFGTPVAGSVVRYNSNYGALKLTASASALTGSFVSIDGVTRDTFAVGAVSPAQTITFRDGAAPTASYAGTRDTTISGATPSTRRGGEGTLYLDGDDPVGSGSDHATLLRFDVAALPRNAVVTSATLRFTVVNVGGSYGITEAVRPWDEATATWLEASSGAAWSTAGAAGAADRGATSLGTVTAPSLGTLDVPLNAAGIGVVQGWVAGTGDNLGFVIADGATTDGVDLESSESATVANRPALVLSYTLATTQPTSLTWSGGTWAIKSSSGAVGPGPNVFSGWNAFTDGSGYLHLRIDQSGGTWRSAEVLAPASLGYGRYSFTLGSDVSALPTWAVLGLFTWSDLADYAHREIDYEFSRWDWTADTNNAQMVVQPWDTAGNLEKFITTNDPVTVHTFDWTAGAIVFESRTGSDPSGGTLIHRWVYTGASIPVPGDELVHLNLWLYGGHAPAGDAPVEVIVRSFAFTPAGPPPPTPAGAFGKSSPKNAAKVTANSTVTLSWTASASATSYEYCTGATATAATSCATWTSTGTGRTATVTAPAKGASLYWQVRSVKDGLYTYANSGSAWRFVSR